MFPRSFFSTWVNPPHDFALDLYAYYMAKRAGLTVRRFPVLFAKRAFGTSSWNIGWQSKKKFIQRTLDFSFELRRRIANENNRSSN
jgi:hypothetical protein